MDIAVTYFLEFQWRQVSLITLKPGGSEEGPICYVDEHNVDICQVQRTILSTKLDRLFWQLEQNIKRDPCPILWNI
jgi:hypothetical protein